MGVSPWYLGQLTPILAVTLKDDSGNVPPLTSATITSVLRNTATGADTAMAGAWVVVNAATGLVQYTWAAADVSVQGTYNIIITVTVSGKPTVFDPIPFVLLAV
jgi:hypothetical protein